MVWPYCTNQLGNVVKYVFIDYYYFFNHFSPSNVGKPLLRWGLQKVNGREKTAYRRDRKKNKN